MVVRRPPRRRPLPAPIALPLTCFRVSRVNPPDVNTFTSNYALGKPPRGPELTDPRIHKGISVFDTFAAAAARTRAFDLGNFIAELQLDAGTSITFEKTLGPGHYTLTGDPQELLNRVVRVETL